MTNGASVYAKVELDKLVDTLKESGVTNVQITNAITTWLTEDVNWINNNISQVDKELLIKLGRFLQNANSSPA